MFRALFAHMAWADAEIFSAARQHAAEDQSLRSTLHHIVMVQRAFLSLFLKRPFDIPKEMQVPASWDDAEALFRGAHGEEAGFVGGLGDADLSQVMEMPWIQGCRLALSEALMQVVMHSQHHRGQCAARLRELGATPPMVDFIIWNMSRPAASWR